MATKNSFKKRIRYVVDKDFQFKISFKYTSILMIIFVLMITAIWFVRSKSYSLLPNDASMLTEIDPWQALHVKDGQIVTQEEGGIAYFPMKFAETKVNGKIIKKPAVYNAFDLYLTPILIISIANLLLIIGFSIVLSHKMAGPMVKIRKTLLDVVNKKKPEAIKLRGSDEFQDVAALLNEALKLK